MFNGRDVTGSRASAIARAGMGPEETQRVIALLRDLVRDHTIILIGHDMDAVFAVADTLTVLMQGELLAHGRPDEIRANQAVLDAYLGRQAKPVDSV